MFAHLLDEPIAQIIAELQPELEAVELQVTGLQMATEKHMTILESIQLLNELLEKENAPIVIEKVTSILSETYLGSNVQAKIALKYVPLNNSRIQMLIEIMEQMYSLEARNQAINEKIAAIISSLVVV